ncbi:trypsin-like serine peptidase [Photobacterium leiognathi]|uniref:trypsin-like serine peptidase n=1 Tax=Photobacterium leiognathi TaxID=553611 RepID=UPI002737490B|nr:trypsin-like serine protease [Photobacterium leiognathi]
MNIYCLTSRCLCCLALLFSSLTFSLGINDSKYIELGGSLDPSVANNVSAVLEQNANAEAFNAVGLVVASGYCSGTWLGSDDTHSYILTAAHCLAGSEGTEYSGQYVTFKQQDGTILAAGQSTNYFQNFSDCSNDIAVAKIPKVADPVDSAGNVIPQPLVDNKLNTDLLLSPTTFTGFGIFGTRTLGQLAYIGKRHGEGHIRYYYRDCLINQAIENTNSWAFGSPGDSGSAIWQTRNDKQVAVGVTSWWFGWYYGYSGHVPIALHIDWLKNVVPMLKTVDDQEPPVAGPEWLLTEEMSIETAPLEQDVRGSVYYVKGQNVIDGPARFIWRYPRDFTKFSVMLTDPATNKEYKVWLKGQRKTHCGWGKINNSAWCYPAPNLGQLKLEFSQVDNPKLPIGNYQGVFSLMAKSLYDQNYSDEVEVAVDVDITSLLPSDGLVTNDTPYVGPRYEETVYGTVYYLSEHSINGNRVVWRRYNRGHTKLEVEVKNTATGDIETVILRGERHLGCGWTIMNNAAYCRYQRPIYGELRVSFIPDDNIGLPVGEYVGSVSITAKGLHNRNFRKDLNFDVQLNITE